MHHLGRSIRVALLVLATKPFDTFTSALLLQRSDRHAALPSSATLQHYAASLMTQTYVLLQPVAITGCQLGLCVMLQWACRHLAHHELESFLIVIYCKVIHIN